MNVQIKMFNNKICATATFRMHRLASSLLAALLLPATVLAADLPTNGSLAFGQGNISNAGNTTTVNQTNSKLIINWDSFNIGANKTVNFNQPGANSIALNRVVGSEATNIAGQLNANGQIFLLNANGVLFTAGARVNAAGLVASTLNLSNDDFLSGNYRLKGTGKPADVSNAGTLHANAAGGYIVLAGDHNVSNQGEILAFGSSNSNNVGSQIALLAGKEISLDLVGNNLVKISVDAASVQKVLVQNQGMLVTPNGRIAVTALGTNVIENLAVNNTGIIVATGASLNSTNGVITLEAGQGTLRIVGEQAISRWGNGMDGYSIVADRMLKARAGVIYAQGRSSNAYLYIMSGALDFISTKNTEFKNVALSGTGNQSLATTSGKMTLSNVVWVTEGDIALNSYGDYIKTDGSFLSALNIKLNGNLTTSGATASSFPNLAALMLSDTHLVATNTLTLNGNTNITSGVSGPGGIYLSGTNVFKANQATITGYTNAPFLRSDNAVTAGIRLNGTLALDGQFNFQGTSGSSAPAIYIGGLNLDLVNNANVTMTAIGNNNNRNMNIGLVGIAGVNRIKGTGNLTINATANNLYGATDAAIYFYGADIEALDDANVIFNGTSLNAGSGIRIAQGLNGAATKLKNIDLNGQSFQDVGIAVLSDNSTRLENVTLNGTSTKTTGLYVDKNVLILGSLMVGTTDAGVGIDFNGTSIGSSFIGVSNSGAGVWIGAPAMVLSSHQMIGYSQSNFGVLLRGSVANSDIRGTSTTGTGVFLAQESNIDQVKLWGYSESLLGGGFYAAGKMTNSDLKARTNMTSLPYAIDKSAVYSNNDVTFGVY